MTPHTPTALAKMQGFGFDDTIKIEKDRTRKAIEELEDFMGIVIDAIIPIALAEANTSTAVAATMELGKIAVTMIIHTRLSQKFSRLHLI
jgi:hypothetical protein